jgi:hypothetical protein
MAVQEKWEVPWHDGSKWPCANKMVSWRNGSKWPREKQQQNSRPCRDQRKNQQ